MPLPLVSPLQASPLPAVPPPCLPPAPSGTGTGRHGLALNALHSALAPLGPDRLLVTGPGPHLLRAVNCPHPHALHTVWGSERLALCKSRCWSSQVNRSTALLKSLSAERERWEKTSETFKNQMSTIAGDCLLSAAFIAYAGYFDQQMRQNLFTTWSHHLQQANIQVQSWGRRGCGPSWETRSPQAACR